MKFVAEKPVSHFWDYLSMILVIGWILNFIIFLATAMYLGGDALNGKIENGHYFLGSHGIYTEVSYNVFVYSKIHTIIFLITHSSLFVYIGVGYLWEQIKKRI